MTSNNRIILDQIMEERRAEIAPGEAEDRFFEYFVSEQSLKDFGLSYDEIESGLVGGGQDGGIDGLFILVNGQLAQDDWDFSDLKKNIIVDLVIVQAKLRAGFQEPPMERFVSVSDDLFDLSKAAQQLGQVYNPIVVDLMTRFHEVYKSLVSGSPSLRVTFVYGCKGPQPDQSVARKRDRLERTVKGHFSACAFDFRFLGAEELVDLSHRQPQSAYVLPLAENPISVQGTNGFVCLALLRDFYEFIIDEKKNFHNQIFESNVRDYQGSNEVNAEIQDTLQHPTSEDFWWLNNGVSIVASNASMTGGKSLTIQDPEIVNGLQTSREVYEFYKEHQVNGDDRKVLLKVMVPDNDESRDRIIKATNSQTRVQLASLRATEKIHRNVEDYLRHYGLFYDRRKNFYKNAGKQRDNIIGIGALAQAVMAILLRRPDTARARPSMLLKDDGDYKKIFNPQHPLDLYLVCAKTMQRVEAALRTPAWGISRQDRNNLRYYIAMHAVAGVRKTRPGAKAIANFNMDKLDQAEIKKSLDVVKKVYDDLGADDQVAKGRSLLDALLNSSAANVRLPNEVSPKEQTDVS